MDELDPRVVLAHEWLDLDLEIRRLTELKADVGLRLARDMTPGSDLLLPNGVGVRLVPPRSVFNAELAVKHLPPEVLNRVSRPLPQAKLAREFLEEDFPDLLAQCMKTSGEPSLRRL